MSRMQRILVTGATGFVGSHLHALLLKQGHTVLGATRKPNEALRSHPGRDFRTLDVADEASCQRALEGIDAAVYLVHSMADHAKNFERTEEESARNFARAAAAQGVKRIVYLGGVQPDEKPSRHLYSRMRTGEVLRAGEVPCIELQASMIIGAGSESFRIVRDLSARLPVMLLPRWLQTKTEPIALDDVLYALSRALEVPCDRSVVYALPGPEVMTGQQILERTTHLFGTHPPMLGVPLLTPRLSSYWITLVTRADKHVSRELVEGLTSDLVAHDLGFWRLTPDHQRLPFEEAMLRAMREEQATLSLGSRMFERVMQALAPHHQVASRRRTVSGSRS